MSRPSVESTLFRARRRLTEEYSELVSGERCRRIQAIISSAATGTLGTRDQRRMARHVSYCQPCRRQARLAGLDASVLVHTPVRAKIAAWLPLPAFLKRKWGGGGNNDVSGMGSNHAPTIAQWSSTVSDPSVGGWVKAAATAATIAIAGAGAGAVVQGDAAGIDKRFDRAHILNPSGSGAGASTPAASRAHRTATSGTVAKKNQGATTRRSGGRSKTTTSVGPLSPSGSGSGTTSGGVTTSASAPTAPSTTSAPATAPSLPGTGTSGGTRPASGTPTSVQPLAPVQDTVDTVGSTVTGVTDTGTKAGDTVDQTVNTVTGALPGG
jgi:hypothetical protein